MWMQVEIKKPFGILHPVFWEAGWTKRIEVTITLGDRRITLEGPEGFVREEVERLAGAQTQIPVRLHPLTERSERDFVATKKPEGHAEIVAT